MSISLYDTKDGYEYSILNDGEDVITLKSFKLSVDVSDTCNDEIVLEGVHLPLVPTGNGSYITDGDNYTVRYRVKRIHITCEEITSE